MIFTELRFLAFFVIAAAVAWRLPHRARKLWLLAASYIFYAAWDWRFVGLIVFSTVLDYVCALRIEEAVGARRRWWLGVSLAGNLGTLGFFKYWDFFVESAGRLLGLGPDSPALPLLGLVLPVGISFYTFQTLSYSIDVFSGRMRASKSLLDVAFFVAFFPQLVAGPIVRARDFLPQLERQVRWREVDVLAASTLFLVGFFKKACLADNLSPLVERYFADPLSHAGGGAWLAIALYTVLVYCDFSGYTDMAIGAAALLGYRLCLNFAFPLLATNLADFWRRWHISMSSWFFDYVYVPLGGSRRGSLLTWRNLMITMLVCGLWHGAAWNFVLFGLLHGAGLVVHRAWKGAGWTAAPGSTMGAVVGTLATFWFFALTLLAFRTGSPQDLVDRAASLWGQGQASPGLWALALILGLAGIHWLFLQYAPLGRLARQPAWLRSAVVGALAAVCLVFMNRNPEPFVYFQF